MSKPHILIVLGTRPEAIKLAPLIKELQRGAWARITTCVTAQHRALLDDALRSFAITPDVDLDLMVRDQDLGALTARVLGRLHEVFAQNRPDLVVVQGDTTTAMAAALAGYFARLPVAHVEAGLRTHRVDPWPEESNRRIISQLAALHFAPTDHAQQNLIDEAIDPDTIEVVGNTGIDAAKMTAVTEAGFGPNVVLLTCHRRENQRDNFAAATATFRALASTFDQYEFVLPLHPSPRLAALGEGLREVGNLQIVSPLDYPTMLGAISSARVVVTDSGGVQEEAAWFGTPCVVVRPVTDRPESVQTGHTLVSGMNPAGAVAAFAAICDRDLQPSAVFGVGDASQRIVTRLRMVLSVIR